MRWPAIGALAVFAVLCVADVARGAGAGVAARAAAVPPCFGAAARDPRAPCVNNDLNRVAIPSPYDAALEPSEPCARIERIFPPACAFGTPAAKAQTTVALLGDSHSTHWRAAVAYVARRRQWHGVSMNRNLCPFTLARTKRDDRCKGWARGALRWLGNHPEVKTLFVSANATSGVQAVRGQTLRETTTAGYQRAWSAVPRSVREVYVMRDVPRSRGDTADCVTRAVARHRNPAVRCARPRGKALTPDLEAEAADLDPVDRVKAIDLTAFMCDEQRCPPVVGGALVIKDIGHMTRTFSRTLGPFLGQAVDALRGRRARSVPRSAVATAAAAVAKPVCFGAAARDPEHPCVNRSLTFTAIPGPYDAPLEPSAPCAPIAGASPAACSFGAARGAAVSTIALLGDSHATAWRAAVEVVAAAERWHGVSITRNNCPFTFARTPGKGRCKGWADRVRRWLKRHPEVRRVIVGANSGSGVAPANGHTQRRTKIEGYIEAWKSLPQSVREIYVLRDVPHSRNDTAGCVARAVSRHRNPAERCSRPRNAALLTDESAVAAQRTDSERVEPIDLSRFMCDETRCFPVVGGALVIKDIGHLTRTFSGTLGPFLGRAIDRLRTARGGEGGRRLG